MKYGQIVRMCQIATSSDLDKLELFLYDVNQKLFAAVQTYIIKSARFC
jgi:hypothetical protein